MSKLILFAIAMLMQNAAIAITPVVVFDYDGKFMLDSNVTETVKSTYVGGAMSMLRQFQAIKSVDVELGNDDWQIYLKVMRCYQENPKLIKRKITSILKDGCR